MSTLKHLAHGVVVYLGSLVPTLLATHVTVDRSLLLSLVPGFIAALASSLGDNVTAAQVSAGLSFVERYAKPLEARIAVLEGKKPAAIK